MISIDTIDTIITENIKENNNLEYKAFNFTYGKWGSLANQQKENLLKVISSFANANGGTFILGIAEENGILSIEDVGVKDEDFDKWELSFRDHCKSKIRPMLHGVKCIPLIHKGKNLIVISVPSSIMKPHAINDGAKDAFYIRYGNACKPMGYDDLKKSFTEIESLQSRTLNFRDDRIRLFLSDDIAPLVSDKPALMIHIVPTWSMDIKNNIDVNKVKSNHDFDVLFPISNSGNRRGSIEYNLDGIKAYYGYPNTNDEFQLHSYTQLFHNGSIEICEIVFMNLNFHGYENKHIYDWCLMENQLNYQIYRLSTILDNLKIPKPYNIFASMINVKEKQTLFNYCNLSKPIARNIVKASAGYIDDTVDFSTSIAPLLNSLANAFGMEHSNMYDESMNPVKEKFNKYTEII